MEKIMVHRIPQCLTPKVVKNMVPGRKPRRTTVLLQSQKYPMHGRR
jgi:hypothetical protein